MDWVDRPKNYKGLYGILQLLQGSHLDNFSLKTLKLGWVAFHSWTFQLRCLDFQSNRYKKLAPVLSRFCTGLFLLSQLSFVQCWLTSLFLNFRYGPAVAEATNNSMGAAGLVLQVNLHQIISINVFHFMTAGLIAVWRRCEAMYSIFQHELKHSNSISFFAHI